MDIQIKKQFSISGLTELDLKIILDSIEVNYDLEGDEYIKSRKIMEVIRKQLNK